MVAGTNGGNNTAGSATLGNVTGGNATTLTGAAGNTGGAYCHLTVGLPGAVRSSANNSFGKGVTKNIVEPTTSGGASWPGLRPVGHVHATARFATFCASISRSPL